MFDLVEIIDKQEKSMICENILRALQNWFGIEESIVEYKKITREMPFYAVKKEGIPVGFAAVKVHNPYTAEMCVIGVLQEYHRQGIGKMLVDRCVQYCTEQGMEYLTVKTLDESRESRSYEKTRRFYYAMGFRPLEVFKTLWNEENPCLFMARYLKK